MRKYAIIRGEVLRTLQILASEDLPVNTENLLKHCADMETYRQCGGLIRRLRTNDIIDKNYKMTSSFLEWLETKK